jgi:ATP-dependent DNA ligase
MFEHYTAEDYKKAGIIGYEPMTAKEVMENKLDTLLTDDTVICERKLDGVRIQLRVFDSTKEVPYPHCRLFSRNISLKTGFYSERTDNFPHFRDYGKAELANTILDGELLVPNVPFSETSAVVLSLPEESISKQEEVGKPVFNAFDILFYKGKDLRTIPLIERKGYLEEAVRELSNNYVVVNPWYQEEVNLIVTENAWRQMYIKSEEMGLYELRKYLSYVDHNSKFARTRLLNVPMSFKAYFQYITKILNGEGIMLKDPNSIYEHKRTRAYQKVKKEIDRDVIIIGFTEPTKEYGGKFPKGYWEYFFDEKSKVVIHAEDSEHTQHLLEMGFTPVTKNFFYNQVGGIEYGVVITEEKAKELKALEEKSKGKKKFDIIVMNEMIIVKVGECEGITEEDRAYMTKHKDDLLGTVIEVKGNEIFNDTGRIRHPRFVRYREDKRAEECTWETLVNI